jgi:cellulose biosynthesis protein BcsQ
LNEIFRELRKTSHYYSKILPIQKSERFQFDILPGDPSISLYEDFLSKDWFEGNNGEPRGLRTTLVFKNLLNQLEALGYEFVLFDVGPSLGAINRSVLIACDFFVLPMSSDIFSLKAVANIETSLKEWKTSFDDGLRKYRNKEREEFTLIGDPIHFQIRFLGYITQQYTAKTKDGKKQAVKAFDKIIKEIPGTVKKHLQSLNDSMQPINYALGEIPTLHSLIPLSQTANSPIFELTAEDGVVGAHFAKVKDYKKTIGRITTNILNNLGQLI